MEAISPSDPCNDLEVCVVANRFTGEHPGTFELAWNICWVRGSRVVGFYPCDHVPRVLCERLASAVEFSKRNFHGDEHSIDAKLFLVESICWAGIQGRLHVPKAEFGGREASFTKVRDAMVNAIADVFPEEGFAELVVSFCPHPKLKLYGS